MLLALKSKDSEKGEIVVASARFFCETANRCIVHTVRLRVRIFTVVQNTSQNRKADRGVFRCRVCSELGKLKISLYS